MKIINPKVTFDEGGNITTMSLCKECSEDMGIVNSEEYHDYNCSKGKLTDVVEKNKRTLLDVLFRRNK